MSSFGAINCCHCDTGLGLLLGAALDGRAGADERGTEGRDEADARPNKATPGGCAVVVCECDAAGGAAASCADCVTDVGGLLTGAGGPLLCSMLAATSAAPLCALRDGITGLNGDVVGFCGAACIDTIYQLIGANSVM